MFRGLAHTPQTIRKFSRRKRTCHSKPPSAQPISTSILPTRPFVLDRLRCAFCSRETTQMGASQPLSLCPERAATDGASDIFVIKAREIRVGPVELKLTSFNPNVTRP